MFPVSENWAHALPGKLQSTPSSRAGAGSKLAPARHHWGAEKLWRHAMTTTSTDPDASPADSSGVATPSQPPQLGLRAKLAAGLLAVGLLGAGGFALTHMGASGASASATGGFGGAGGPG